MSREERVGAARSPVAITGIECVFPGAEDKDALWDLLMRGGDAMRSVPDARWDTEHVVAPGPDVLPGTMNTRLGGYLDDIDLFDNDLFGIAPREAAAMDPQLRLLLQCAWRAMEDAGTGPRALGGSRTGVFVGAMGNEWALRMGCFDAITPHLGSGTGHGMMANRISYQFDLRGPSVSVDTACSSSLVAVDMARTALARGECDHALVCGVNVILTPALGIFYTQAGLSAPDGRCKPFSSRADGIGRGEGAAVVVLRRLDDALAAGDRVYAVIRGGAVNHGGRSNGFAAPNRISQREVITAAYAEAGVEPADVRFVEAHGTGTVLGDMIETAALGDVHAVPREQPCAVGSVKGNLGHTEGAAGTAALIKTALALHHGVLPASLHSRHENSALRLAERGLRLVKAPLRLPSGDMFGAVSSFGLGGTNAHLLLSGAPSAPRRGTGAKGAVSDAAAREPQLFTLSAPDPESLRRNLARQAAHVTRQREADLPAMCHTSRRVKAGLKHRFSVTVTSRDALAEVLGLAARDDTVFARHTGRAAVPKVGLLFTGQGSQYPGMTADVYRRSAVYRRFLTETDEALGPHLGDSVVRLLLDEDPRVREPAYAQPMLFAVEHALGRTLLSYGVEPAFVLGHSIGEFAAACLTGALSLADAARLVCLRGALMQRLPAGGGMLAVLAPLDDVLGLVADEPLLGVAAINGPRNVVVSGDGKALSRVNEALAARGVRSRRLEVSHAFHSPLMAPVVEEFAAAAASVSPQTPGAPLLSTVLGGPLDDAPLDAAYWTRHITAPVLFADAARAALALEPTHLVEVGPRPVLKSLVSALQPPPGLRRLSTCSGKNATAEDLLEVVAALYRAGLDLAPQAPYTAQTEAPHRLAPYVFSPTRRFDTTVVPVRPAAPGPDPAVSAGTGPPDTELPGLPGLPDDLVHRTVVSVVAEVGGYSPAEILPDTVLYDLGYDSLTLLLVGRKLQDCFPRLAGAEPATGRAAAELRVRDLVAWVGEHLDGPLATQNSGVHA
ncbi:type I polyketide synthase [Streptomyces sp. MK5]|uniref:type I polyketide synthase n=1 Tax=Streptomyces sp. MK5 TaxID=3064253 RepID=UPI0027418CD3|nr:beta-ketoacyl synthase N-terminal-like domain-containing protein [Streptomyces sp. MK5]